MAMILFPAVGGLLLRAVQGAEAFLALIKQAQPQM
jgi:hypothetical protein